METRIDRDYTQAEAQMMAAEIALLREELRLLRAQRFGQSSEKSTVIDGQQLLFNEAEYLSRRSIPEPVIKEAITNLRQTKKKGKREADLAGLEHRRIDYELSEDERICPVCAGTLHEMDVEIRSEIEYIPASVVVLEHATHVYACRTCQKDAITTPVIRPSAPKALFSGSLASPSLLAQILTDKYCYHLPLYRQEAAFKTEGLSLSRQTLANWVTLSSEMWLLSVYEAIKVKLLQSEVLAADETEVQVLHEVGRKPKDKSYMWLYRTGLRTDHPLIVYEYKQSRAHKCPKAFLGGWSGHLMCDGWGAYHKLGEKITISGCWAHARRYFADALKATPEDKRTSSPAFIALELINRLFELERSFGQMSDEERLAARTKQSVPIAEELYQWALTCGALPKSLTGKAVHYLIEQKPYLMNAFTHGGVDISNNLSERSIKPFVIGRKNWLFANTPRGANASAAIFSVIETAKANNLRVYEYVKYLFEQLPNITTSKLDDAMPWSDKLPDHVKVPAAYIP